MVDNYTLSNDYYEPLKLFADMQLSIEELAQCCVIVKISQCISYTTFCRSVDSYYFCMHVGTLEHFCKENKQQAKMPITDYNIQMRVYISVQLG